MSHSALDMASMEYTGECLGFSISRVDDTGDVGQFDVTTFAPLLYCEMLYVDMSCTRGRAIVVDDVNGSLVIDV